MKFQTILLLRLLSLPRIGSATAKKIVDDLLLRNLSGDEFKDVLSESSLNFDIPKYTADEIQKAIVHVERIEELSDKEGVRIISIFDSEYPERLKRLKKPPLILNYIGNINSVHQEKIGAVIGTRSPTPHGYEYGLRVSQKLAEQSIAIVSGLAKGCDTAGHTGCINGKGDTIAVIAQGILMDKIYPKENRILAKEIVEKNGLILSEYTIDQKANRNFFVERDRIQAGLSDFLFVVETGVSGGSMHTVKYALESRIPVIVYNHPEKYRLLEQAEGNQNLIKEKKAVGVFSLDELNKVLNDIYKNVLMASKSPNEKSDVTEQQNDAVDLKGKKAVQKKKKRSSKNDIDPSQSKLF